MKIAAIPIAAADLGSDGGVIDGCARVHWRGRAMFPAAGDGSGTFVFRRHLRGSLHVYCAKVCFSGGVPLPGVYFVARSCISGRELFFMDSLSFRDPFRQCSRSSSRRWGGGGSCRRWRSADSTGLRRDPGFQLPRRLWRALDFVVCTPCDGSAMPCSYLSRRKI